MEKINIAELLKDCPSGMELDCAMFENVTFVRVDMGRKQFPIEIAVSGILSKYLTKEGCFHDTTLLPESKCVIFPKGKITWEGFVPPCKFKNGDVVYTSTGNIAILGDRIEGYSERFHSYCGLFYYEFDTDVIVSPERLATEEEKQILFNAIKANGYRWDEKTKTLENLIEPKFKIGDKIKRIKTGNIYEIIKIFSNCYIANYLDSDITILFNRQDEYELVPDKFDITTLKPFESKVLVRNDEHQYWIPAFWGFKRKNDYTTTFGWCRYCIPYKGNEHLLGTTDDCDEFYKTWK